MGARFGEHDLFQRGFDADASQPSRQELPERRMPERRRVLGQFYRVGTGSDSQRFTHAGFVHPGGRQPPAPWFQRIAGGFKRLARDPQRVDLTIEPGAEFGQCQGRHGPCHVVARARAGAEHPSAINRS